MMTGLLQMIVGIILSFLGALLLLRAWLYYWAFSPRHPLVELCRRFTDWAVSPLGKIIPAKRGFDAPSVLAAFVTAVVAVLSYRMLTPWPATPAGLVIAPFAMLLRWSLEMISWGTIIWAVLSWVNPGHPLTYTLSTMLDPFLRPCRRILPTLGGFDLSPVLLILAANVVLIFVTPLSRGALTF